MQNQQKVKQACGATMTITTAQVSIHVKPCHAAWGGEASNAMSYGFMSCRPAEASIVYRHLHGAVLSMGQASCLTKLLAVTAKHWLSARPRLN
jgi:hypothetical protein